jgi:hypothetical protein
MSFVVVLPMLLFRYIPKIYKMNNDELGGNYNFFRGKKVT